MSKADEAAFYDSIVTDMLKEPALEHVSKRRGSLGKEYGKDGLKHKKGPIERDISDDIEALMTNPDLILIDEISDNTATEVNNLTEKLNEFSHSMLASRLGSAMINSLSKKWNAVAWNRVLLKLGLTQAEIDEKLEGHKRGDDVSQRVRALLSDLQEKYPEELSVMYVANTLIDCHLEHIIRIHDWAWISENVSKRKRSRSRSRRRSRSSSRSRRRHSRRSRSSSRDRRDHRRHRSRSRDRGYERRGHRSRSRDRYSSRDHRRSDDHSAHRDAPSEEYDPCKLYVYYFGLFKTMNKQNFLRLFPKAVDVEIPDSDTAAKGFAFVKFNTPEEAKEMYNKWQGRSWKGRRMIIWYAKKSGTLDDEYKPRKIDNREHRREGRGWGHARSPRRRRDDDDVQSLEGSEKDLALMDYDPDREPSEEEKNDLMLYVWYTGKHSHLTEDGLESFFPKAVRIECPRKPNDKSMGYAFVTFDNPEDCKMAHDTLQGKLYKGDPLIMYYSRKRDGEGGGGRGRGRYHDRRRSRSPSYDRYGDRDEFHYRGRGFRGRGGRGRRQFSQESQFTKDGKLAPEFDPCKLYVYYTGPHEYVTEDTLRELFPTASKFTTPMRTDNKPKGFAFAYFEKESTCKATHDIMQGIMYKGYQLVVWYAKKREFDEDEGPGRGRGRGRGYGRGRGDWGRRSYDRSPSPYDDLIDNAEEDDDERYDLPPDPVTSRDHRPPGPPMGHPAGLPGAPSGLGPPPGYQPPGPGFLPQGPPPQYGQQFQHPPVPFNQPYAAPRGAMIAYTMPGAPPGQVFYAPAPQPPPGQGMPYFPPAQPMAQAPPPAFHHQQNHPPNFGQQGSDDKFLSPEERESTWQQMSQPHVPEHTAPPRNGHQQEPPPKKLVVAKGDDELWDDRPRSREQSPDPFMIDYE